MHLCVGILLLGCALQPTRSEVTDLLAAVGVNRTSMKLPRGILRSNSSDGVVNYKFKFPILTRPAREVFPDGVPLTFGILAQFKLPRSGHDGDEVGEEYLFSMNNADDTGVVLGMSVQRNQATIIYTDPMGKPGMRDKQMLTATITPGVWTMLLVIVEENTISLHADCDTKPSATQELGRTMPPLRLHRAGNMYVGRLLPDKKKQVNTSVDPQPFRGVMRRLEIYSDLKSAFSNCPRNVENKQIEDTSTTPMGVRPVPGPLEAQLRLDIPDSFLNDGKVAFFPRDYVISYGQHGTYTYVKGRLHVHVNQLGSRASTGISRTQLNIHVTRWLNKANRQVQNLFEVPGEIVFDPTSDPNEDYAVALRGPIPIAAAYADDKGIIEGLLIVDINANLGPYGIAKNGTFFFDNRRIINARVDYRHKKPYNIDDLRVFEFDPDYLRSKLNPIEIVKAFAKGDKGEKGERGLMGRQGSPGDQGLPGPPGPPGSKGMRGSAGVPGATGLKGSMGRTGLQGLAGSRGPKGDSGDRGRDGKKGESGLPGPQGKDGSPGETGLAGQIGPAGSPGDPGPTGSPGPRGPPGRNGTGPPGFPGLPGINGQPGQKGDAGPMGAPGPPGEVGQKGEQGENGDQGEKGDRGDDGLPGNKGSAGENGLRGETGAKGEPGEKGQSGVDGLHGSDGQKGDKGDRGLHGAQGLPGAPGVCPNVSLDLKELISEEMIEGAKGDKGSKGEEGDKGATGAPGVSGQPGEKGNLGMQGMTGEKGEKGMKGVNGEQGEPGLDGVPGSPGNDGERGASGLKGSLGSKGEKGEQGEKGDAGRNGVKGEMGPPGPAVRLEDVETVSGEKGEKGEKGSGGDIGLPGRHGRDGRNGTDGKAGEAGKHGKKGEKGESGTDGRTGQKGQQGIAGRDGKDGERGEKGEPGLKGERGEQGLPGPPGMSVAVEASGSLDKGEKGDPGLPGASGLDGLAGLPGAKGVKGEKGKKGSDGRKGDKGEVGNRGNDGIQGPKGDRGEPGLDGRAGLDGAPGIAIRGDPGLPGDPGKQGSSGLPGEKGNQGDPGINGVKGEPGIVGPQGVPGLRGAKGSPGSPGLPGRQGPPGNGLSGSKGRDGERGPIGPKGDRGPQGPVGPSGIKGNTGAKGQKGQAGQPGQPATFNMFARRIDMEAISSPAEGSVAYAFEDHGFYYRRDGEWHRLVVENAQCGDGDVEESIEECDDGNDFSGDSCVACKKATCGDNAVWMGVEECDGDRLLNRTCEIIYGPGAQGQLTCTKNCRLDLSGCRAVGKQEKVYLASLDDLYRGNLGGIAGADNMCREAAKRAGRKEVYRALLASSIQPIWWILASHDYVANIVNLKDELLFHSWDNFVDGRGAKFARNLQIYSFNGRPLSEESPGIGSYLWHGSSKDGRSTDLNCKDWFSSEPAYDGRASRAADYRLLQQRKRQCSNSYNVLCISVHSGDS